MNNDRYISGKNSKCNIKLDLVNTFFDVTYKNFYWWCSIDKKVLVISVSALNAGISIGLKCGIGTSLIMILLMLIHMHFNKNNYFIRIGCNSNYEY